jgi:protein gp37
MNNTEIEWTDYSSNPIHAFGPNGRSGWACVKVSQGCKNCYAERLNLRFGTGLPYSAPETAAVEFAVNHDELNRWRQKKPNGGRNKVFVGDMFDVFQDGITTSPLTVIFEAMRESPQWTFQILTKRAGRMSRWYREYLDWLEIDPLPNVWLGVSVEDQAAADERIPALLKTPAAVRFLSCEPLLGKLDLDYWLREPDHCCGQCGAGILRSNGRTYAQEKSLLGECVGCGQAFGKWVAVDWVIAGGETGPKARPAEMDWFRGLRDQCQLAGVPFLFKRKGGRRDDQDRLLDGRMWDEFPKVAQEVQ